MCYPFFLIYSVLLALFHFPCSILLFLRERATLSMKEQSSSSKENTLPISFAKRQSCFPQRSYSFFHRKLISFLRERATNFLRERATPFLRREAISFLRDRELLFLVFPARGRSSACPRERAIHFLHERAILSPRLIRFPREKATLPPDPIGFPVQSCHYRQV